MLHGGQSTVHPLSPVAEASPTRTARASGTGTTLPDAGTPEEVAAPLRPVTRLQHGIQKKKIYTDGTVRYGMLASTGEPTDLANALQDKNWKQAMNSEYEALMMKH
jgi:hypothetical protein